MSDESLPFKATLKAGAGYEAPWVTVDAATGAELVARLDELTQDVLAKVTDTASLFRAAHAVSAGFGEQATTGAAAKPAAQPAAEQKSNVTALKTCEHGVRVKRSGTSKRGDWTGYFCPLEKGNPNQCDPIWED